MGCTQEEWENINNFKVHFYLIPRVGLLLKYEMVKKQQRKAAAYAKARTDLDDVRIVLTLLQMTCKLEISHCNYLRLSYFMYQVEGRAK